MVGLRVGLALVTTSLATLGFGSSSARSASQPATSSTLALSALDPASCPRGTLPDGDGCVRLPGNDPGGPEAEAMPGGHHNKSGQWTPYDQIPRRPDRPADYDAYRYPIDAHVVSGYDLDRPDPLQRRGRTLSAVGHGGVDLPQAKGTPIPMMALEHQQGPAEVLYVGPLFGNTVITRHTLREGGTLRDYVVLFGHLDAAAPGLTPGMHLDEGQLVGFVGDSGSPELVHLHLEARRVRDGVDVTKVRGSMLLANEVSVVCDPRNVLPRK